MKERFSSHLFWGPYSPLSALSGIGLIILASSRFAFAIVCAGTLFWVYGLTTLVFASARNIMPSRGKSVVLLFLPTVFCAFFMLIIYLINPLLILGTSFLLLLVPPCCLGSGYFDLSEPVETIEFVSRALYESLSLSGIILALALIREPLGMGTLSIPGGLHGIVELFSIGQNAESFSLLRILSVSAGAFLLLGYGTALYRFFRERNNPHHN